MDSHCEFAHVCCNPKSNPTCISSQTTCYTNVDGPSSCCDPDPPCLCEDCPSQQCILVSYYTTVENPSYTTDTDIEYTISTDYITSTTTDSTTSTDYITYISTEYTTTNITPEEKMLMLNESISARIVSMTKISYRVEKLFTGVVALAPLAILLLAASVARHSSTGDSSTNAKSQKRRKRGNQKTKNRKSRTFTVGKYNVGNILYSVPVDLSEIEAIEKIFGKTIVIEDKNCIVYGEGSNKPSVLIKELLCRQFALYINILLSGNKLSI
ncbi:16051_t:CDS:2 [Entrophospora sp. SA101]|nr:16047_t:CDS:2 [Entrophospora sp. SA101]CAJ0648499.1 16051_t:CDS:2 [Entrophospora sp. SA101]